MNLQEIEKQIAKVREEIDTTASEEVKQLIDELELLLFQERRLNGEDFISKMTEELR